MSMPPRAHFASRASPLGQLIKPSVIETYTAFINHWKHAKEAVKSACLAKTAFSKFLEVTPPPSPSLPLSKRLFVFRSQRHLSVAH